MSTLWDGNLDAASIEPAVRDLHPDYAAVLIVATGLQPGPSSPASDALLATAAAEARAMLAGRAPHDLPEVQVWREAYSSFGVKPRKARSSVESLLRRIDAGLPRIDRLTDVYNAISVRHLVPLGGEDVAGYVGAPRLVVAVGDEEFDTVADGEAVVENPTPGEIVWRDDSGVTCRRWNWRQCTRTRLTTSTTEAVFIIDGLSAAGQEHARAAAADLVEALTVDSPDASFTSRTLD